MIKPHGRGGLPSSKENRKNSAIRCVHGGVLGCFKAVCIASLALSCFFSWPQRGPGVGEWTALITVNLERTMERSLRNAQVRQFWPYIITIQWHLFLTRIWMWHNRWCVRTDAGEQRVWGCTKSWHLYRQPFVRQLISTELKAGLTFIFRYQVQMFLS